MNLTLYVHETLRVECFVCWLVGGIVLYLSGNGEGDYPLEGCTYSTVADAFDDEDDEEGGEEEEEEEPLRYSHSSGNGYEVGGLYMSGSM